MDTSEAKCVSIWRNLLRHMHRHGDVLASAYVREFDETARCDAFRNLKEARDALHGKIGSARMKRIITFDETDADEKAAAQAVMHYGFWHEQLLLDCLPLRDRVLYHTVDRAERTLAALGIVTAVYGGARAAYASFSMLKRKANQRS